MNAKTVTAEETLDMVNRMVRFAEDDDDVFTILDCAVNAMMCTKEEAHEIGLRNGIDFMGWEN